MGTSATTLWSRVRPDAQGLVPAVIQDDATQRVLMVGYMNEAAFARTLQTGRVTFYSRSRQALWQKGETSGNVLQLRALRLDCDHDAILVQATPHGPTCHTGATSCFFRPVVLPQAAEDAPEPGPEDDGPELSPGAWFARVFTVILDRQAGLGATNRDGQSYVRSLLDKGPSAIGAKIEEEAGELTAALADETDERVASEAADLVFHLMVGLAHRGLAWDDVARVLAARFGVSGLDEKADR